MNLSSTPYRLLPISLYYSCFLILPYCTFIVLEKQKLRAGPRAGRSANGFASSPLINFAVAHRCAICACPSAPLNPHTLYTFLFQTSRLSALGKTTFYHRPSPKKQTSEPSQRAYKRRHYNHTNTERTRKISKLDGWLTDCLLRFSDNATLSALTSHQQIA